MEDIIVERAYAFSMEQVWEALTSPAALAEWLMPGDFRPVVGHCLQFHCHPGPDFDGVVDVEILAADPPRLLSYSWKTSNMNQPTTVTFFLSPPPEGGTLLRLEHKGFEGNSGKVMHPIFKGGWGHKLAHLLEPAIEKIKNS